MYINESLANGLKERLWTECNAIDTNMRKQFTDYQKTHRHKLGSRTAFIKWDQMYKNGVRQKILASIKTGTRASPVMLYAVLDRGEHEQRKNWSEKMFRVTYLSIDSYGRLDTYRPVVKIGEHAVMRVFQRRTDIYNPDTFDFDIFKVISEFHTVGYLAQLMSFFFHHLSDLLTSAGVPIENLSVPFVSENGLFLGEYSVASSMIDIRTYIADHQMTSDQSEWVEEVRIAIQNDYNKNLPFVAIVADSSEPHQNFFYANLYKAAPAFARLVAAREEDKPAKIAIQQTVIAFFGYYRDLLVQKQTACP